MEQFRFESGLKPLRADGAAFHPGSGGGGSFYMGRQDQPETPEEEREEEEAQAPGLDGDACRFQPRHGSRLTLQGTAPEVDLEALADDLKGRVRYLTLALSHMERGLDRRLHAEIGSVTIYRSA